MHEVDQTTEQMVRSVLAYAENRLRMNPVPLDKGVLPADELYERLDGVIRDGFIWGRGAWDNKGNLYSMMEAVEALAAGRPGRRSARWRADSMRRSTGSPRRPKRTRVSSRISRRGR